ncbi:hypothetical protein A3K86_18820 [Photobacterium jeanii]|uniref:Uncharacterized protein n=1 Tax=Photobacterium jeanii TaxID=858640 RepID=A0A178K145_9GAMM|nr:hypothetical protein [Photobacterium jeanii]OAN11030.1 hypothetical protein A3K86_18820 [Photobacterium jeanii]PST90543.1 hypothetical protein C9I91_07920 [Photobacterium jeanii]
MSSHTQRQQLQLFYRESDRVRLLEVDQLPAMTSQEMAEFHLWLENKRDFTPADTQCRHWLKTCSAGHVTELVFHSDGTVDEFTLFRRQHAQGVWRLEDGVIHIALTANDHDYRYSVIANRQVNIHSAIEYKNNQLHAYLKLAQVK